ncbi:PspC domain-containing protein [Nocardioides sp. zg-ZUI104]|uniref:PspC domain-containing protein n=1 Tax=Nocardioides faecalis TaxID=2803858 RepID=UPI001BCF6BEA|nr:PspC domain-containing protein [Nocardioides faecalis]MBS4753527.1 PspC domain-containing protein [Nocardioides faecalis]
MSGEEVRNLGRLRRSRTDRKVAGVAAGLARHLDIDPLLVRIAFVALTIVGGGGPVLYGAAWLVVPEEDTEDAVIDVDEAVRTVVLLAAGALAAASLVGDTVGGFDFPWALIVGAVILVAVFAGKDAIKPGGPTHPWLRGQPLTPPRGPAPGQPVPGPPMSGQPVPGAAVPPAAGFPVYRPGPPPVPPRPSRRRGPILFWFTLALAGVLCGVLLTLQLAGMAVHPAAYPATVMATCGVMLVVGAFYGRAGGLILVGLLAAAATAVVTVSGGTTLTGGDIDRTPSRAADVRDLDLGVGELRVDLSEVRDLEALDGSTLRLDVRVGKVEVVVPDRGLTVRASGDVGLGEVKLFGEKDQDRDEAVHDGGEDAPVLNLDTEVFVGEIIVHTEEEAA